jgi:hypothetical protein
MNGLYHYLHNKFLTIDRKEEEKQEIHIKYGHKTIKFEL